MRPRVLISCLIVGVLLPIVGSAQVMYRPTPAPPVTAASATWQINGEPIFFAGSVYYPTGPTVFFDGQLMARVGEYLTVPLYADTTLEAYSRVFVPIGGAVMKPYERRRAGSLAGTVGSTTPSWPVQVAASAGHWYGGVGNPTGEPLRMAEVARPAVVAEPDPARPIGTAGAVAPVVIERTAVESVPRPTQNTGISITFQGAQWVSSGPAVAFSPERFVPVGDYHGFPVYRDARGSEDVVYVTVVPDGPLAPYARR